MITIIISPIVMVLLNGLGAHGSAQIYRRMVYENECTLLVECKLHQVPVRSKIECYILTARSLGSGAHYSPASEICNVCLPTSPSAQLTTFTSGMDYHAAGRLNKSIVVIS